MTPFFISDFLNYLQVEKRYSDHTVVAYQNDLNEFKEFVQPTPLVEVEHKIVRSYIHYLKEENLSNTTINRKISALRTFYKWLERNGNVEKNPLAKTMLLKQPKRLPSFVKETEIVKADSTEIFSEETFGALRDKLMFELFYQTGVRLSELIELKTTDIHGTSIRVFGKRNKERIIPISPELNELIKKYLSERNTLEIKCSNVFVKEDGNKLYEKFVYRKINYYLSVLTNVEKKSPHVLRHTFATHLLNNGAGIEAIKSLLGHADLRATQVYTHNTFGQLKNIYSQAHPRGR
ncbi:MAG TPA: tyrosine-type recombinase/integrase [Crocinitomicaceae bacterium]|nr:tyrosine-type recombinase/integrase [Crocinitomicaceae bacterium]